jgi:hypothetical protein
MFFSRILFISFISGLGLTAGAQTAQQIVDRQLAALGGKERLQSINSIYLEGVAVLENNARIGMKTWKVYDRLYREEVSSSVGNLVIIVTPRQGWSSSPLTNGVFKVLTDQQYRALKPQIDPAGPLVDYNAKGNKVELAGKDTVDGHECYKLKVYFPSGNSSVYSIDAKTWYTLRETRRGGGLMSSIVPGDASGGNGAAVADGVVTLEYSDYKVTPSGYIFPFTITTNAFGAKIQIGKIEVNRTVDVSTLSKLR